MEAPSSSDDSEYDSGRCKDSKDPKKGKAQKTLLSTDIHSVVHDSQAIALQNSPSLDPTWLSKLNFNERELAWIKNAGVCDPSCGLFRATLNTVLIMKCILAGSLTDDNM